MAAYFYWRIMERLDKLIANSTTLSRKEVHRLIKSGSVRVNGIITKDRGLCINEKEAEVKINDEVLPLEKYIYIMLNKPPGVVSAARDKNAKTVIDLVPEELKRKNLFPAGRLDKDTTGFILITDDGDFAHKILSPKNHVEKTYEARLAAPITQEKLDLISNGILLKDGTLCLPAKLQILENGQNPLIEIKICEGKYHQIKRMFAAADNHVEQLRRAAIGSLSLDEGLAPGECRLLCEEEINLIST